MTRLVTFILACILLLTSGFVIFNNDKHYEVIHYESFSKGEILDYKMNYGWFTVGKGQMLISDEIHNINNRKTFKVDVYGKTSGMVDWVAQVDDHWGSYVDTAALVPHVFYRKIKEGKYRKNEITRFDHTTNNIEVKTLNNKTGEFKEPRYYSAPENVRSMLSGALYLRAFDFDTIPKGSKFVIDGFFEDTFYDLDVIYEGVEKVKTKVGTILCHKLVPIMPNNKLFDGENSITAYLSADKNKVPVKVEANMFIGKASVELVGYKNVKHKLNIK